MFPPHAKRILLPLAVSLTPVLASSAGCDWVDQVDHVNVNNLDGGGDAAGGPPAARFRLAAGATTAPNFMDVPFPSDAYLGSNGRIASLPGIEAVIPKAEGAAFVAHDLSVMNGFSRVAMSLFYVDDPSKLTAGQPSAAEIDKASLPATEVDCMAESSSVFLVDLQPEDATKARIGCRAQFHTNIRTGSRSSLAIGPARGLVLAEGHQYAAVLTSRVKLSSGKALTASADFDRIRKGDRNGALATLYGTAIDKATAALGSALSGTEIVSIAPFTTNKMTDELFKLREATDAAGPAPDLKWGADDLAPMAKAKFAGTGGEGINPPEGFTATLDQYLGLGNATTRPTLGDGGPDNPGTNFPIRAHNAIASIGTAVFEATTFLQDKGTYAAPGHLTFARTASGDIDTSSPRKVKIWATFAVPLKPPQSDAGYHTIIVQHGLNSSRDYLFALANSFAAQGYLTVAIDSITFGARAAGDKFHVDDTTDYFQAKDNDAKYGCPPPDSDAGPPTCHKGDGIADVRNEATDLFGHLINVGALRDQMRQAALDTTQLVRVLRKPENQILAEMQLPPTSPPDPTKAPKIDGDHIAYIGNSLGGIQGATAAAIEPHIKQWVLNVAGGGLLTELATHSPRISANLELAAAGNFGLLNDKMNESHPLVTLLQTVADPGDPLNYADLLIKAPRQVGGVQVTPRNIFQIEAIYDEVVPNESNEALARAGGWGLAKPNVGSNAGITDVKSLAGRDPNLLPDVQPDDKGVIRNTHSGATAAVVQVSPSQHGSNLESAGSIRVFAAPFARFDEAKAFPLSPAGQNGYIIKLAPQYLQLQTMIVGFLAEGFAGATPGINVNQAPSQTNPFGFTPPVRDIDADGKIDSEDSDPNDKTKQ